MGFKDKAKEMISSRISATFKGAKEVLGAAGQDILESTKDIGRTIGNIVTNTKDSVLETVTPEGSGILSYPIRSLKGAIGSVARTTFEAISDALGIFFTKRHIETGEKIGKAGIQLFVGPIVGDIDTHQRTKETGMFTPSNAAADDDKERGAPPIDQRKAA